MIADAARSFRSAFSRGDDAAIDPDDVELPLSMDRAMDLLRNDRRRWALEVLAGRDESDGVTIGDLATDRAAAEEDVHRDLVSSDARKAVYVGFYQCHLPKLDDWGLLEFDSQAGSVHATPATEEAVAALDVWERMLAPSEEPTGPVAPEDFDADEDPAVIGGEPA